MSDFDVEEQKVERWLQPLADESAPCGPDLEYDNAFLALVQAAAGKPESQFGSAEPPDWRTVLDMAESLLDQSRDLRIAIFWLRASLHLVGYGVLPAGLKLLNGLIENQWAHVHPRPDPDDGDPYARVNALTLLREPDAVVGDLREASLIDDRAVGQLSVRGVELALGLSTARTDETAPGKDQIARMLATAVGKAPGLRAQCQEALVQARRLMALTADKLGSGTAPDLRPLFGLINAVASQMPGDEASGAEPMADAALDGVEPSAGATRRSLSGSITSRDEAMRAIDMICEYLERAEPANPAPLFLKRARQLISHNFLQLLKALAPDALAGVAGMVGIDPEAIEDPDRP